MKNDKNDKIDGRFENYRGTKRFCVSHPDYSPTLTIAAPCEAAAIVAAAQKWGGGVKWTAYSFYAYCSVYKNHD